jgi:hypothetical protein
VDSVEVAEDSAVPERCTKQFVLTVDKKLKFLSSQPKEDQCTVENVILNTGNSNFDSISD